MNNFENQDITTIIRQILKNNMEGVNSSRYQEGNSNIFSPENVT